MEVVFWSCVGCECVDGTGSLFKLDDVFPLDTDDGGCISQVEAEQLSRENGRVCIEGITGNREDIWFKSHLVLASSNIFRLRNLIHYSSVPRKPAVIMSM